MVLDIRIEENIAPVEIEPSTSFVTEECGALF
jgi:hypothetical protein